MDWAAGLALLLTLAVAWFALLAVARVWRRYEAARVTVYEHEAGLRYSKGRLTSIVGAGRYATWPTDVEITRLDLREQSVSVAGQEILTADKLPVRVSMLAAYKIVDPRLYASASNAALARLYQAVQIAVRARVAARTLDDLLADRDALAQGLAEELAPQAGALGFAVGAVSLLDLTLGGPAKQAFADLWRAQKEGQAALERARGEQAALRALANAARALKGNPELMNLRVLQALSAAPGKAAPTVVLGGATGLLPVSAEPSSEAPAAD